MLSFICNIGRDYETFTCFIALIKRLWIINRLRAGYGVYLLLSVDRTTVKGGKVATKTPSALWPLNKEGHSKQTVMTKWLSMWSLDTFWNKLIVVAVFNAVQQLSVGYFKEPPCFIFTKLILVTSGQLLKITAWCSLETKKKKNTEKQSISTWNRNLSLIICGYTLFAFIFH